jgi:outer membrane lipoprotein LolB
MSLLAHRQFAVNKLFTLAVMTLMVLLNACSLIQTTSESTPSNPSFSLQHQESIQALRNFGIEGRMAVQYDGRGYSCQIHWHNIDGSQQISLISPLGNTLADISVNADGVILVTSDGKQYAAKDAEQLTQQILGWPLPVSLLHDWVFGRPAEGMVSKQKWDSSGRLLSFAQNEWSVEYQEYRDVETYSLPGKLSFRHAKIYLRLIIDDWQVML